MIESTPLDGKQLTEMMHQYGLNIRYLGEIATTAKSKSNNLIHRMAIREMISRSAKHLFSAKLRETDNTKLASTVSNCLNLLFGRDAEFWKLVVEQTKLRYQFDLPADRTDALIESIISDLPTLRSVCRLSGFQIIPKLYNISLPEQNGEVITKNRRRNEKKRILINVFCFCAFLKRQRKPLLKNQNHQKRKKQKHQLQQQLNHKHKQHQPNNTRDQSSQMMTSPTFSQESRAPDWSWKMFPL